MRFVTFAVLALAACPAQVWRGTPAEPPQIELVESWPSETSLDSELRDAAVVWPEMIASATRTIDLAQFYVSNAPGSRLEPVIRELERAVQRRVRVRLLVDKSFVKVYPDTLARLARAGVSVRHADFTPGVLHAKYFIVDGREAFLGSQNFDWRALEHILELGVRVREPAIIAGLAAIFAEDWARAGNEPPPATMVPASALVASPPDRLPAGLGWDLSALVAAIDSARTRIRIQLLTYRAGDWNLLEAPLRAAAARGVRVDLVVADWSKQNATLPGLRALARVRDIEVRFVTIPQARRGFIPFARVAHAKLLVVDDRRVWIGTSNWERDYFETSRNVGIVVEDPKLAARAGRFIDAVMFSSYAARLDPDAVYTPPRI